MFGRLRREGKALRRPAEKSASHPQANFGSRPLADTMFDLHDTSDAQTQVWIEARDGNDRPLRDMCFML